ncbi:MAG: ArsS family sensor histidine kinase [Thiovulaceae bacterium]|nr:ArsS family sensor histidine kinase [Sulfurimonadaceae bacterium]
MSIFKKITLLFLISLSLMVVIGYQTDKINTQRVEALITQKYLQDADKIFSWLATATPDELQKRLTALELSPIESPRDASMKTILMQPHSFGELTILKSAESEYLLYIRYMDDMLLLSDRQLQNSLQDQWLLNILVLLDIAVLVIIFFIILKILSPLREIISKMQAFAKGKYQSRAEVKSRDEIGEVAQTYNMMAQDLEDLITSRQELLRDVGHELKTPIAKGLFAVATLEATPSKAVIHRAFSELERLIAELLEIEKLHALKTLKLETFKAETLILEALSRLILEDESKIAIEIRSDFTIRGDLNYLALALKNLIDNALKYALEYPVSVTADEGVITVKNRGKALSGTIAYYTEPFTREENARQSEGYGLGLNIVKKILEKHHLTLEYAYVEGFHLFSIRF